MLNKHAKIARSNGIDLPILKIYLAGRISGDHIEKCLGWRKFIINHYKNFKVEDGEMVSYPLSFIDPLNSGEADSVDKKGLTSSIPPNLIYDKDLLSVETADVVVANMEDFFEEDLYKLSSNTFDSKHVLRDKNLELVRKIENRRENIGTVMEVAWALYMQKPVILIVPERRREIFETHPFTKRASVIVTSPEQLIKEKWLQLLYKAIAGAEGV